MPIPATELAKYGIDVDDARNLWSCQMVFHLWTAILSILSFEIGRARPLEFILTVSQVLTTLAMILIFQWQAQTMLLLANDLDDPLKDRPLGVQMFQIWVYFEVFLVAGITVTNLIFLLVRSCFRNNLILDIPDYWEANGKIGILEAHNVTKDYMQSSFIVIGIFQCFFAPFFCSLAFLLLEGTRHDNGRSLVILLII